MLGDMVLVRRVAAFAWRVLRRFFRRKGLLLTSAVAYNALLSIVPVLGLVLALLSRVVDPQDLRVLVAAELNALLPVNVESIIEAYTRLAAERELASGLSLGILILFSSLAFKTIDDAMSTIFDAPQEHHRKRFPFARLLLPLGYVVAITAGLLVATLLTIGVDHLPLATVSDSGVVQVLFEIVAFVGSAAFLTSFYRHMPDVLVPLRYAVLGGLASATMWEVVRRILAWYFDSLSLVGVIYGSLATVVVLLLCFEIAALVVLLGGQVVAEVMRSRRSGHPWYVDPDDAASP